MISHCKYKDFNSLTDCLPSTPYVILDYTDCRVSQRREEPHDHQCSRRTDIPAFYSDWFFKRLEEGYLYVRNPMNPGQVSKILLNQDTVDCFVFWTKDPDL